MPFEFSRRSFLVGTTAFFGLAGAPSFAMTENAARQLVNEVVADVQKVISSGKSDAATLKEFERLFVRYADTNIMAQYALGADGRSASASDKRAFTNAFKGYISRKYGKRFRDFIGGRIDVQSARPIKSGYEVKAKAVLTGQGTFEVAFHVSDRSGSDKIFNVFIEGVNLLLTERTEIGAMLDQRNGNIKALAADLEKAG